MRIYLVLMVLVVNVGTLFESQPEDFARYKRGYRRRRRKSPC